MSFFSRGKIRMWLVIFYYYQVRFYIRREVFYFVPSFSKDEASNLEQFVKLLRS